MSTYKLSDVTALNGNPVVQINNADSVLGAVSGSFVQIGDEQGVFLDSVDMGASQITLTAPWPYPDAINVECTIAPFSAVSQVLSLLGPISELREKTQALTDKYTAKSKLDGLESNIVRGRYLIYAQDSLVSLIADGDLVPETGVVFECEYYDNAEVSESGTRWKCSGITTLDTSGLTLNTVAGVNVITPVQTGCLYVESITPGDYYCFVLDPENLVDVAELGIKANSPASDWQSLVDLQLPLYFGRRDRTYYLSGSVHAVDKSVDWTFAGCKFIIDYTVSPNGFTPFTFEATFKEVQAVSQKQGAQYDFGNGNTQVTRLTVSDASKYAVSDVIKVISEDQIVGLDPADGQKLGETHIVGAIDTVNNYIYLLDTLRSGFNTDIRVAKYDPTVKVKLDGNVTFQKRGTFTGTNRHETVLLRGLFEPETFRLRAEGTWGEFLSGLGCYHWKSVGIQPRHLLTDLINKQYGYGIIERSCAFGEHHDISAVDVRHAYTDGAGFNPTYNDFAAYGRNEYAEIYNGRAWSCGASAWDTHPESYEVTFHNCRAYYPYRQPGGTLWGFQARGLRTNIINCHDIGGDGVVVRSEYASDSATRGTRILGFTYKPKAGETNLTAPVRIEGIEGGRITDVVIRDLSMYSQGSEGPLVSLSHAEVDIHNPQMWARMSGSFSARIFELNNGSVLNVYNGLSDYTDSLGANLRHIRLADGDSVAKFYDHKIRLKDADLAVLVDFNNQNGKVHYLGSLDMDKAPSFSNPSQNKGVSAELLACWTINGGVDGRRNLIQLDRDYNFSLNGHRISEIPADRIDVVINVTIATIIQLTDIPPGSIQGQQLVITSSASSLAELQINNSANLQLDDYIRLQKACSLTLVWVNSHWIASSGRRLKAELPSPNVSALSRSDNFSLNGVLTANTWDLTFSVFITLTVTGNTQLTDIPTGNFEGQQLVIFLDPASTTLSVLQVNNSTNMALTENKTLSPGDSIGLVFISGKWRMSMLVNH